MKKKHTPGAQQAAGNVELYPQEGLRVRSAWPNGQPQCEFPLPAHHFVQATPEQMRALALMLLQAAGHTEGLAKTHTPKGDAVAVTLTYPPQAGDALLDGLLDATNRACFEDWKAKRAAAAARQASRCGSETGSAGQAGAHWEMVA